jgi:metal-responsive CopG/Arc/MetJ family transcriptional regulator
MAKRTPAARERYTLYLDPDLREAVRRIKERDGISESEQIRRAVRAWVEERVGLKQPRSRAATRKR